MGIKIHTAIKNLISHYQSEKDAKIRALIKDLKDAYLEYSANTTETQNRVEFLRGCLELGMSKRDAARELHKRDPRISLQSAETIVYTVFSGQYRTSKKGRNFRKERSVAPIPMERVDITDDENLL